MTAPIGRSAPAGRSAGLRVAMALYGDLSHDSRVIREAESLAAAGHAVTVLCLAASATTVDRLAASVRVVVCEPPGTLGRPGQGSPFLGERSSRLHALAARATWLFRYGRALAGWGRLAVAAAGPVDVWHAHDLTGLQAIAPLVERDVPIVYDSHELFLETGSAVHLPGLARRWLMARERRLVSRCAAVVTVNPGIAAQLERLYHPARIVIVRNCLPRWTPPATRPDLIREAIGLADDTPIVLFHGSLEPDRGIEQLIAALDAPDLADLHLVLMGYGEWQASLEAQARDPRLGGRLHVIAAVSPADLPRWVASADVGAVLQQPTNLNLVLSTPNKLFEAIAVGTPVLASDLPEIARIVRDDPDGPLGVLCDPVETGAIADALRWLLEPPRSRLRDLRERCLRAATARLNWEAEASVLVGLYAELDQARSPLGMAEREPGRAPGSDGPR